MARTSEWAMKVLALLRAGRADSAIGQIKVAPTVKDLAALRTALAQAPYAGQWPNVNTAVIDTIDALSSPRLHRSP